MTFFQNYITNKEKMSIFAMRLDLLKTLKYP